MYQQIVDVLIEKAQSQDVVYAVPGHPRVAETTTAKLLDYNDHHQDVNVKMLGGKSFIDDIFAAINQDPNDGFTFVRWYGIDRTVIKCAYTYTYYSGI